MTWSVANQAGAILTVQAANGRKRTLRPAEILDLVEVDDDKTEVIYRSGAHITVRVPFDQLHALWTAEVEAATWQPA